MNIIKSFTKQKKRKYYTHIDYLPIANFNECGKGKLQYLYICDFFDVPETYPEHFKEVYEELFYQFPNPDMTLTNLKYKIALNYNKAITEDAPAYISKAQSLQHEYNNLIGLRKEQSNSYDFNKIVEILEQWRRTEINIYKMSTARFYVLKDMYEEHVKKLRARNG